MKNLILVCLTILPAFSYAGEKSVMLDIRSSIPLDSAIGQKHVQLNSTCELFIMSSKVSQVLAGQVEGMYSTPNNGRRYATVKATTKDYVLNITCASKPTVEQINSLLKRNKVDIVISNKK